MKTSKAVKFSARLTGLAHQSLGELKELYNSNPLETKNHSMNSLISLAIIELAKNKRLIKETKTT